jgi:hypothetical protein
MQLTSLHFVAALMIGGYIYLWMVRRVYFNVWVYH